MGRPPTSTFWGGPSPQVSALAILSESGVIKLLIFLPAIRLIQISTKNSKLICGIFTLFKCADLTFHKENARQFISLNGV